MDWLRVVMNKLWEFIKRLLSCKFANSERYFPPNRPCWKWAVLAFLYFIMMAAITLGVEQLFFEKPILTGISHASVVYASFFILITCIIFDRYLRHRIIVHKERLEDPSEVLTNINGAKNVGPRLWDPNNPDNESKYRPYFYAQEKEKIQNKISELEKGGEYSWTEQKVLALDLLQVDFQTKEDLRAWAESLLNDLEEYAEDSAYRYDKEYYGKWKERIAQAERALLKKIPSEDPIHEPNNSDGNRRSTEYEVDDAAEELRAAVRMLLTHLADYRAFWTEGSVIIRGIMIIGGFSIPLLLVMGLTPYFLSDQPVVIGILNWGLLGIVGSLAAVLLALRKSDLVEVGNTEGKKELWRAIIGSVLGLVAGVLAYALIAGDLIQGKIVPAVIPEQSQDPLRDLGLAVIWSIGAGFSIERIFERIRGVTDWNP